MGAAIGTAVPIIAVICSNIQYSYPLKTTLQFRQQGDLGALNPVPWAVSPFQLVVITRTLDFNDERFHSIGPDR